MIRSVFPPSERPHQIVRGRSVKYGCLLAALVAALVVPAGGLASAAAGTNPLLGVIAVRSNPMPGGDLVSTTIGLDRPAATPRSGQGPRPGWSVDVDVPTGTQQLGLVWSGDPDARFTIRTRGSAWSAATDLAGEITDGPDARSRPGAGPIWVGSSGVTAVRVELVKGFASHIELDAMTFRPNSGTVASRSATDGIARPATPAGGPPIHLRSTWAPGGWVSTDPVCGPIPRVNANLRHAIVHHTDGTNTYSPADVPGILAGIYQFHTAGRGWCDIAYNFLIDRFGGVWEGRLGGIDNAAWGGHAKGFNAESVGVSLMGQFQPGATPAAAVPSAAMLTALRDVLAWKVGSQGLDPLGHTLVTSGGNPRFAEGTVVNVPVINGHRDTAFTSCPGEAVYRRLPQMRIDVSNRIAATNDPVRWRPHVTGAKYWTQMFVDAEGSLITQSKVGSYTSAIVRAGLPQGVLTASVVLSPKTDSRIGLVDRLYRTVLDRAPDTAGLTTNVRNRDRGMTARDLAGKFLQSSEFATRYGTPDDAAFVGLLFHNALGREATQHDIDYWMPRLTAGLARQDLTLIFANSTEHKARIGAATKVTTAFFVMVRRVPSEASRAYWEPRLEAGTPNRDLVVGLLRGPEYLARF